jgi:MFS family permease
MISQREGYLTLLKKKSFLRLWLAQLISMTIFNAGNYALLILIGGDKDKGSTTQIGIAIICFSLPAILFGAPAGAVVDHMDKRRVLWGSNMLRAIATFLFVLMLLFARSVLLPIYLLTFIVSTISQFFTPAEGSTIPLLVNEKELAPALSLFNVTFMLSQALGYVLLAPILIALLPSFTLSGLHIDSITLLYLVIVLLYLVCAFLMAALPKQIFEEDRTRSAKKRQSSTIGTRTLGAFGGVWQEMAQGWSFVRNNKALLLAVIQLSFAGVLILVIGELATPIVTKLLFLTANAMAFVFAPAGIGLVGGSVLMPRLTAHLSKTRIVFGGTILLCIAAALLPLSTLLFQFLQPVGWNTNPLLLLTIASLMLTAGVALSAINMPALTTMQELTPDWIKGRVLALQLVLYNAASIPVILFIAAFSDLFGISMVLYIIAGCTLTFGLWGYYYEKNLPPPENIQPVEESPEQEEQTIVSSQTH